MQYRPSILSIIVVSLGLWTRCHAVFDSSMAKWAPSEQLAGKLGTYADTEATWYAQYRADRTGLPNPETYETNALLAELHFHWLADDRNAYLHSQIWNERTGWLMVAVLYDPETDMHFASTVPRGPRNELMKSQGSKLAPAWFSIANTARNPLHAEDGAYFNYEEFRAQTAIPYVPNTRYPRGMIIATYGAVYDLADPTKRSWEARTYPACSSGATKDPSCQDIAERLGVQFSEQPLQDAEVADTSGVVVDDNIEDLTPSQEEAAECVVRMAEQQRMAIRGRQVVMRASNTTSAVACSSYTSMSVFYEDSSSTSPTTTTPTTSSSPTPTVSCWLHDSDPDQGNNQRYCVCNSSRTLPLISYTTGAPEASSCSYTTLPPTDAKRENVAPITAAAAETFATRSLRHFQPTITPVVAF